MTQTRDKERILKLSDQDNVFIALTDLVPGVVNSDYGSVHVSEVIPAKHKFTAVPLEKGEKVVMYGVPVGQTVDDLTSGSLLTTENIKHFAERAAFNETRRYRPNLPRVKQWKEATFDGYLRNDGRVGTANYWLFVPLVFCQNRNLRVIEDTLLECLGYQRHNHFIRFAQDLLGEHSKGQAKERTQVFPNIDGVKFLRHDGGCGGTRQDAEQLLRLLAGYVHHPNVVGATVLSLGCQHAQIDWFKSVQHELYPDGDKPVIYLEQQQIKSEDELIKSAIKQTIEQLYEANKAVRQPFGLEHLSIGLECGGSDGFSGISANPLLGKISDIINTVGGQTVLSEFPELNGVEQNLINRCVDKQSAIKFLRLQEEYGRRAQAVGSGFDQNPSPGNLRDGLITDAIKSAGAATKGGMAPVTDVLNYTEPVKKKGLNLLCTPGNDVESTTAMVGSGANLVLFTTGLGTPTGNPIVPVIKVSSNTKLYEEMSDIIDFNAGGLIDGTATMDELVDQLMHEVIAVASGRPTKSMNLGQDDFIFWKQGVSL
ncbi:MAG: altronate dehydratase family protein [Bacteroidota bacterium]